ncbi:hypothetical protein RB596_006698 [Gaeumannomyces avenae]
MRRGRKGDSPSNSTPPQPSLARLARAMTTRRVSQETSKYFAAAAAAASPRRSARVSLSRFAHRERALATATKDADSEGDKDDSDSGSSGSSGFSPAGSDIEDAVPPGRPARPRRAPARGKVSASSIVADATRKRKRTATVVATTAVIKSETSTTETTVEAGSEADQKPASKPRRDRKPARARTDPTTGAVKVEPPSDWEEMYALVKEMRLTGPAKDAAVDTMGCERLASPDASPKDRRFHTLIALMLSSQTKDTVNAVAMARLKSELPPCRDGAPAGLNLDNVLAVEPAVLNSLIYGVGFHNNKTKYIKQAAEILRDRWAGDIPDTIEGLMSLPGVGPKMAHLCMSAPNGWDRVEGVGVDVHVHRITNLWGWNGSSGSPTKNPEATRAALESWLPRDRWREINWLLVGFGQTVCLPVGRKCGGCEVGLAGLCRAADRKKVAEGRRMREEGGVLFGKKDEVAEVKMGGLDGGGGGGGGGVGAVTLKNEEEIATVKKEETVETVVKQEAADELVPIKEEAPESPDARPAKTRRRARGR